MATHRTCDIAILTALGTELDAVLKMLPELKPTKPIEGWFFHEGSIRAQGQGTVYEVVAATSEVSGQGPARALAEITLKEWSPRYLILVGIAAGCGTPYGKEYRRGDILVSTHILDYMRQAVELPKLQETGLSVTLQDENESVTIPLQLKAQTFPTSENLVRDCSELVRRFPDWHRSIPVARPKADDNSQESPSLYPGIIASGPILAKGEKLISYLLKRNHGLVGLEMEGNGFASAVHSAAAGKPVDFCLIKAVSDYGIGKDDKWHEYAKIGAAAFSSELIRKGILQKGAKQPGAKWDWKSYLLLLKEKIGETLPYGPQLHVPLRKYKSFDQILSSPDDGDPIEDFAEHVLSSGATLLHGAGGSGKSVLLHHMTIILIEREVIPIIVDLSALRTLEAEAEDTVRIPPAHLLKRMLSLVVPRPIGTEALSDLEGQAVLILDGFNELSNNPEDDPIQKRILACLQTVRADHPDLKVIVADRFHPRPEANAFGYGRLSVRPLEVTEVAKLIPNYDSLAEATKEILRVPFFLSLWLLRGKEEHHATHMNKAEMLKDALTKRAKLDDASLEKLGVVMYEAYRSGSQYFRPESIKFADSKLLAAGFLIVQKSASGSEQLCRFSHQLLHDYLAGLHVAKENVPWDEDTFDALSLRAQSLETIQLTLEQVPILRREEFLSRVYDWNYTSALLCLAEEERLALSHGVTEEIRTAIIASIAEKQFDSFPHSRALNIRALGQLPKTLREPFLRTGTKTEKEIRDYVRTLQSRSQWFVTWQSLFARLAGGTIEAYDLQYVVDENPLIGWAAASLIRRSIFEKRILERLLGILIGLGNGRANRSKRWRIISVLGASDEPEALIELFQRLTTDEYRWVRYGAMRSVIEIAARNKGQRGKIFKELLSLVGQLHELSRYELSRVLRIEKADEDWLFLS